MSEHVRGVKVYIEVDTTKNTYSLESTEFDLDEVADAVRQFIEGLELYIT